MKYTKFDWLDVSDELYREYIFPNGAIIRVNKPKKVAIKAPPLGSIGGGSHRVVDKNGLAHYISYGWIAIRWLAEKGKPAVAW